MTSNGRVFESGTLILAGEQLPTQQVLAHCQPILKKVDGWRETFPVSGEESDNCFPELDGTTEDSAPFGPWYDDTRFTARAVPGDESVERGRANDASRASPPPVSSVARRNRAGRPHTLLSPPLARTRCRCVSAS